MTHKISLKQPKYIINAVAGTLTFLAALVAVKNDDPNAKTLSWIVAVGSAAIGVVNEGSSYLYEDNANIQIEGFIKYKDKKIAELADEVEKKRGLENQLRQEQSTNNKLLEIVAKLKIELETYQNKTAEEKVFADAVLESFTVRTKHLLNTHLEETICKLKKSIDANIKRVEAEHLTTRLNSFKIEIENKYIIYKSCIAEIEQHKNKLDFVTDSVTLFNQVQNDLASLRVKFIRTLGVNERLKVYKSASQEYSNNALPQLAEFHQTSYDNLMAKLAESKLIAANHDEYMQDIIVELEKAMSLLAQKDEEIKLLKRPQYWSTPTRDDQWVANIIIHYFEQQGIILDRAHNDYEHWQAILGFHIDRNRRLVTVKDLNKHSKKLKRLIYTINTPEFKFDHELGMMTVWVQMSKRPPKEQILRDDHQNWS